MVKNLLCQKIWNVDTFTKNFLFRKYKMSKMLQMSKCQNVENVTNVKMSKMVDVKKILFQKFKISKMEIVENLKHNFRTV